MKTSTIILLLTLSLTMSGIYWGGGFTSAPRNPITHVSIMDTDPPVLPPPPPPPR
jgi:hypothetical protein